MTKRLDIPDLLKLMKERPLIDVRTPAEFEQGHIYGARNLPLFTNEERAMVGTTYKQVGPREAMLEGLDFVGPRMRQLIEEATGIAPGGKIAVHCWRGGKRSDSVGWLLNFAGFDVVVLNGGYKAFRRYVLDWFEKQSFHLVVLGGYTGTGKTEILREIARRGEQVLDLEGLANHKGSAFGALGENPQPTVEQFENTLFHALYELDSQRRIWVENESRAIGRVYIPDGFWKQMRSAPLIHVDLPLKLRIDRLVREYAAFSHEELVGAFQRIKKRLGGQHLKAALVALDRKDYETAAAVALRYYDKTYAYGLEQRQESRCRRIAAADDDPVRIAGDVLEKTADAFSV